MHKDHQKNIIFVKALVDEQPVEKRIEIYRWLADLAGVEWITTQLHSLANELEAADRTARAAAKHNQEFDLALSQSGESPSSSEGYPTGDGPQNGNPKHGDGK